MREILGALAFSLLWPPAAAVSLAIGVRGTAMEPWGCVLMAVGTAGAYALDRWRDGGTTPAASALLCAAIISSTLVSAAILWHDPWRLPFVALLGLLALSYVPLKQLLPKNSLATVAWTLAVVILPAFAPPDWSGRYGVSAAAVACIMFANTTLCDLGTITLDRSRGVKSISVCYGAGTARIVAFGVATAGAMIAATAGKHGLAATAAGHALIAVCGLRSHRLLADAVLTLLPGPLALLMG